MKDAHAIVTGGSAGIGLATARALAARGSRVSLVARGREGLDSAAAELRAAGARVATASADVADRAALESAIGALTAEMGPCDILVTSAGFARPGYFERLGDEHFRSQMEVNYFGTFYAVRAVVPSMIERRRGSVVGISSTAGLLGVFGYTAYTPTKYAVRGFLECLRAEMAPYGIHVGCAFPPDTLTPGLDYENRFKPPETKAVSGSIKPVEARRIGEAIARGIEQRRFWIIADPTTALLARASGLLRGTIASTTDRKVRKAQRAGPPRH